MPVEIKYTGPMPSPEARINARLRPSSMEQAKRPTDYLTGPQTTTNQTRCTTTVHESGSQSRYGSDR
jgi:hypothetical protein